MKRLIGNLRTLGVLPCGECRAYVPLSGCEHYTPRPERVRRPARERDAGRERVENSARFDHPYGVMRLAYSTRMGDMLRRAASGEALVLAVRNDRHVANSLMRAGLLSQSKRGGPYLITEDGQEVWRKVLAYLNGDG